MTGLVRFRNTTGAGRGNMRTGRSIGLHDMGDQYRGRWSQERGMLPGSECFRPRPDAVVFFRVGPLFVTDKLRMRA